MININKEIESLEWATEKINKKQDSIEAKIERMEDNAEIDNRNLSYREKKEIRLLNEEIDELEDQKDDIFSALDILRKWKE